MRFTKVFVCLLSVVRLQDRGPSLAGELLCSSDWHAHITMKVVNLEYRWFYGFTPVGWNSLHVERIWAVYGTWFEQIQLEKPCSFYILYVKVPFTNKQGT